MSDRTIQIELRVDGKGRVQGDFVQIGKAGEDAFQKIKNQAGQASTGLKLLSDASGTAASRFKAFATALLPAVSVAGLALFTKRTIEAGDAIVDAARAIGIGTDALQELRFAFGQLGVEEEKVDSALRKFSENVGRARAGTGELAEFLRRSNTALLEQVRAATSAETAFDLVTRAVADQANELDAGALAVAAFGEQGTRLAAALRGSTQALEEQRQRARELGIVIGEDLLKGADDASDRLRELGLVVTRNLQSAVLQVAPQIADFSQKLAEALPRIVDFINTDWIEVHQRKVSQLRAEIAELQNEIDRGPQVSTFFSDILLGRDPAEEIRERQERIAQLEAEIAAELERRAAVEATRRAEAEAREARVQAGEEARRLAEEAVKAEKEREKALKERELAHAQAVAEITRLEDQATTAGLEGVAALAARRDLELQKWHERLDQQLISAEEHARAQLAIEEAFQREKAAIERDEADRAARDATRERERHAKEQEREARQQAEEMARPFLRAAEGIQDGFADAFFEIFRGTKNRNLIGDFLDHLRDAFARTLSELATLAIARPIIVPVVAGAANLLIGSNAAAQLVSATGGPGGGGGFSVPGIPGLSNLLPTGAITSAINSFGASIGFAGPLSTAGGIAGMPGTAGVTQFFATPAAGNVAPGFFGSGATLSATLGAATLGFVGGSMLADLVGLNSRNGGIGGGIGAGIGMAVGGPVGAFIGGAAGSLLGGLFGKDKDYPYARATIRVDKSGKARLVSTDSLDGGDEAGIRAVAEQIIAQIEASGATFKGPFRFTIGTNTDRGRGDKLGTGFFFDTGSFSGFAGGADVTNIASSDQLMREVEKFLAGQAISADLVVLADAIKGKGGDSIAAQIKAIAKQFDELRKNARALNLTKAEINKAEREALDQLAYQLTGGLIGAAEAFRRSLEAMGKQFDELRKNARALGLSVKELDAAQKRTLNEMLWQQRTQLGNLAGRARQLLGIDSLEGLQSSLTVGPLSPLSLSDQFSAQAALVRRTAAAALAGDVQAAQNFAGIAQSALQLNNQVNASGPAGAAFFSEVNRLLNRVLEQQRNTANDILGTDVSVAIREAGQDQIRVLQKESRETQAILREIRRELKRLNAKAA